nr:hypothetical protein [Tanacetum cinerariifolium]
MKTKDSLKIGDEHLDTIPETESDEFIKSSVENLVPNPNKSEDLSDSECDVPACDDFITFSNLLFDADDDFSSIDNESFSDEDISKEIYSNPLFDEEIISIKIDPHHFNDESDLIESLLNHDSSIISSSLKIDSLLDKFADELILLKTIPPGIDETDCDPEEEIRLIKKLLYNNSSPRPPEEFISKNSDAAIESLSPSPIPIEDNDSFMEEIDLSFTSDDLMPSGIENDDYESKEDMHILEELLSNDSLSLSENESFHFDIPSSPCPPAKPPNDDEIKPNSRILTVKVVKDSKEKDKIKAKTKKNQEQTEKRGKVDQVKEKVKVKPAKTGHGFGKSTKNQSRRRKYLIGPTRTRVNGPSQPNIESLEINKFDEEISCKSSDEDDDDVDDQSDADDDDQKDEDEQDDDDQDDNDDDQDSDNDGDDFVHPKLTTHDEEAKDKESFNPIVQTPSLVENSDDEGNDDANHGMNVGGDEGPDAEDDDEELYRDVNVNLKGRDVQMTDVHTTQVLEDTHVTLTPVNPDGQQQITTTVVPLLVSAPTLPPPSIPIISQAQQAPAPSLATAPSTSLQDLPNFGSLFGFDHRLKTLEANFSEFMQINQFAEAVSSILAQAKNEDFLNELDEIFQKIIKEQVKVQVSKILPKIEKTVNKQLEAKVLTRASNSSKTSYAVAADLSELELKKILIEKMESNKSIHRSDEQRNLYKALVDAYEYRGSKRRRAGKEPESTSALKEKASKTSSKSTEGSKSHQKTASESAPAEEPMQTTQDLEDSDLAKQDDSRTSFNELMDTPVDFSAFLMNRLKIDTLIPELLAGPTYKLMKGSCKSLVDLEFFLKEVYKATTDQLDWNNPEGQYEIGQLSLNQKKQHVFNVLNAKPLEIAFCEFIELVIISTHSYPIQEHHGFGLEAYLDHPVSIHKNDMIPISPRYVMRLLLRWPVLKLKNFKKDASKSSQVIKIKKGMSMLVQSH